MVRTSRLIVPPVMTPWAYPHPVPLYNSGSTEAWGLLKVPVTGVSFSNTWSVSELDSPILDLAIFTWPWWYIIVHFCDSWTNHHHELLFILENNSLYRKCPGVSVFLVFHFVLLCLFVLAKKDFNIITDFRTMHQHPSDLGHLRNLSKCHSSYF